MNPDGFTGYAALFDVRDRGGDIIRPGAFAGAAVPLPLLWQHDGARVIGTIEAMTEDARGLKVTGRIDGEASATAREVAAMLGDGSVSGLSFGYRVRRARDAAPGRGGAAGRVLEALELVEVSLVASPMQPGARVETVFNKAFNARSDAMIEVKADEMAMLRDEVAGLKARVEAQGARQVVAAARLPLDGTKSAAIDPARTAFVERYVRRGLDAGVELKSVTGATNAEGGFAVPREIDAMIERTLRAISPIRAIANVVATGTAGYRKLIAVGGTPSGWVSEVAARPMTNTPAFSEIAPPTGHLYANPAASQAMLDDAAFDVEAWLADEVAREFARAEGAAFVTGTGTNQPKGFATYATTSEADGVRAFGTLQYIAAGAAGGFAASSPQDRLIDLVHALKAPYRQGATFVMASDTLARIRKMKTSDGAFIWSPGLTVGQPGTLLGFPVVEAEDMPAVAADSLSIAFGNFKAGYVIADRGETAILRDPFSNKPFVHFYATKRVGGAVINSEAIKLMKFAAN